jgi:hypothetical protein
MKLLPLAFSFASLALAQTTPVSVVIETEFGNIEAEIDTVHAPVSAANFLRYVDAGLYDGARFHRAVKRDNHPNNDVKIEVIQAGLASGVKGFRRSRLRVAHFTVADRYWSPRSMRVDDAKTWAEPSVAKTSSCCNRSVNPL